MRLLPLLCATAVAVSALHCSSEEPAPKADDKVIESHPGALVITSPARAAFIANDVDVVEVKGTGATRALTINGVSADVSDDGSFTAKVKPEAGLNLVVAVDGESRTESPFLYGKFVSMATPVPHAIALDVGANGIALPAPAASLTSVANMALEKRDLLAAFKGQSFTGTVTGATWKFEVTSGHNGAATVGMTSVAKGIAADATIKDVIVDGRLTLGALGLTYARDVRITVTSAKVTGNVEIDVDEVKGSLGAAMPAAEAKLDGFKFDTDNAGFPCCVDSILTGYIKPKVEEAIRDGIRDQLPKMLQVTLDGVGIPKELDLSATLLKTKLPIATRFDGGDFDLAGGTLTAALKFGGPFAGDAPGAKAPGWLTFGKPYAAASPRPAVIGVSFALDAVNQLLFSLWGTGAVSLTTPAPFEGKLTPNLPPIVSISDSGKLRIGLGEVVLQRTGAPKPLCAVTIIGDVSATGDKDALVLGLDGEPTISITWLADDDSSSGKNLIAAAAKDQLGKFLKPFRIPIPKFALGALGGGLTGQSLAIQSPSVTVDKKNARISAAGAMMITK